MPLGKEVGLGPGHIVLDGDPVGTNPLPTFWPMFIVANRSPISATAELLLSGVRSRSRSPRSLDCSPGPESESESQFFKTLESWSRSWSRSPTRK